MSQAMYNEFSTANIQIDKDFSAKLSGYGCVGHIPEEEISSSSSVSTSIYKCLFYLANVLYFIVLIPIYHEYDYLLRISCSHTLYLQIYYCLGCWKPINGDAGERNADTEEQCVELWNFSFGVTYRKKESR
jgi:hypothetical protein